MSAFNRYFSKIQQKVATVCVLKIVFLTSPSSRLASRRAQQHILNGILFDFHLDPLDSIADDFVEPYMDCTYFGRAAFLACSMDIALASVDEASLVENLA